MKKNQHLKLPKSWWSGIPDHYICSEQCNININKYKVKSGTSLEYWESKDWIAKTAPYGWVEWFCHFYNGKRSHDDERQIKRWLAFAGPSGRFRRRLINEIKKNKSVFNDYSISEVIRQGLLQWGYELTKKDYLS